MFGIGMQEIVLVCVIALIVVGPKKMPELARALGKGYGEFRRAFDQMRRTVEADLHTDEIRRTLLDIPQSPAAPAPATHPAPEPQEGSPLPYGQTLDAVPPPREGSEETASGNNPVDDGTSDGRN